MKKVEIYSTDSCHFCHMAKEFFSANNVTFTDYDVGKEIDKREQMIDISGQMGVPVIVIDDKDVIVGFDQTRLVDMLGLKV